MKFNEVKSYYLNLNNYQTLHPKDKEFFDMLYPVLLTRPITESNIDLSRSFKIPVSTLEKKFQRLEASGLIKRTAVNAYNQFGKIRCIVRTIELNTITFNEILEDDNNDWFRIVGKNRILKA